MRHLIQHRTSWWRTGVDVYITLDFTEEEHRIIKFNNLKVEKIAELEPTYKELRDDGSGKHVVQIENNIYLSDLYGRVTSYHCDTSKEAAELHEKLRAGLTQFEATLQDHKPRVDDYDSASPGPKPKVRGVAKDALYEELTKKPDGYT